MRAEVGGTGMRMHPLKELQCHAIPVNDYAVFFFFFQLGIIPLPTPTIIILIILTLTLVIVPHATN